MYKEDIELLQEALRHTYKRCGMARHDKIWYTNDDTMLSIARILDGECYFNTTADVIYFFEKPWKYEGDMQEIIDTYQEELAETTAKE